MIDINFHILKDISKLQISIAQSLAIMKEAETHGIHRMIAAPYYDKEDEVHIAEKMVEATNELQRQAEKENIPVDIFPGQRTRIHGDILQDITNGNIVPLGGDSNYILLEFPNRNIPSYTTQILFDIQIAGYRPIAAKADRNHDIMTRPDKLYQTVKNGTLIQISAASIVGKNGRKIQQFANQMIEHNLAHLISSDIHDVTKQGFYVQEAYEHIRRTHGKMKAMNLMNNAEAILTNQQLYIDPPERIQKKKFWQLF